MQVETEQGNSKAKRYPVRTIRVILTALSWLPLSTSRLIGAGIAKLAWLFNARAARTTMQNIEYCYPELTVQEQEQLAKESLRHTAMTICELPAVWLGSQKRLVRWIQSVEGDVVLRQRVAEGPVLLLLPHFGNWEFLELYMSLVKSYTCTYSPRRMYELEEMIIGWRSRFGGEFLPVTNTGFRTLLRRIKEGGVIIVLPDQVPIGGHAVDSTLRNRTVRTGTFPHALLRRGKLHVFTMVARRCKNGFSIQVDEMDDDVYAEDAETCIHAIDRAIEKVIERDPAQYQWEYKRFRGIAEIYR